MCSLILVVFYVLLSWNNTSLYGVLYFFYFPPNSFGVPYPSVSDKYNCSYLLLHAVCSPCVFLFHLPCLSWHLHVRTIFYFLIVYYWDTCIHGVNGQWFTILCFWMLLTNFFSFRPRLFMPAKSYFFPPSSMSIKAPKNYLLLSNCLLLGYMYSWCKRSMFYNPLLLNAANKVLAFSFRPSYRLFIP